MKSLPAILKRTIISSNRNLFLIVLSIFLSSEILFAQQAESTFAWPEGKQIAISLSFDDARASQVDAGTALSINMELKARSMWFQILSNKDLKAGRKQLPMVMK